MKYGPNTPAVEAVIERAGRLTPAEAESLVTSRIADRTADRDAAWDAARDAAWYAAWDDARSAAWEAARDSSWDFAWVVVWDAVIAEMVRDLISDEHYETLMGPWKSVV
jgi:hypothetical protein